VRRGRFVAAVLILGAFVATVLFLQRTGPARTQELETSASCARCHADIWNEWQASMHAQAFTDPLVLASNQSNNFRNLDCIPCHAPAPVFEHGIGKLERVVERVTAREHGVDCLACHRAFDHVVGPEHLAATSAGAACRPDGQADLRSPALCAPCHNQHNTVDEWELTPFAKAGTGCDDCHMPVVERRNSDGSTRSGRSHRMAGGHDPEMLAKAYLIKTEIKDGEGGRKNLVVSVTNSGAGHNFPADARHRALDVVVTLIQPDGVQVPPREARPYGRDRGTARRRFRNPYREETERLDNKEKWGRENTQILAGETLSLEVPFEPGTVAEARVELIYKLTPIQLDDEGVRLNDTRVKL
jgi:nitrate/TMAO reductase-like tetraheme cytochrome c subunit